MSNDSSKATMVTTIVQYSPAVKKLAVIRNYFAITALSLYLDSKKKFKHKVD